ncbi:hypothetical protein VSDG_05389 [Cytospora chrysosperma]|uniref:Uncharacterized protein n=1 Tax=Cytospora chrysosperma TaxID=252740 RepID=A0A423VZB8_CYTCH|nr:hypothetical protein VSDG_05389 [Valsa sordida]
MSCRNPWADVARQQEMVQVGKSVFTGDSSLGRGRLTARPPPAVTDRSPSGSPFWRNQTPSNGPRRTTRESSLVVGAAYSHADMLTIDSL